MVFTSRVRLAATTIFTFTSIGNRVIRTELCTKDKECRRPVQHSSPFFLTYQNHPNDLCPVVNKNIIIEI